MLATLSHGEDTLIAALKQTWPNAPHQRCQDHFLGNVAEEILTDDTQLRQSMRQSLGGLPQVEPSPEIPVLVSSAPKEDVSTLVTGQNGPISVENGAIAPQKDRTGIAAPTASPLF